jgi:hypothetical protein
VQRARIKQQKGEHDWGIDSNDYEREPVTYAFMFLAEDRTKEQYANRIQMFFDFHRIPGNTLDERGRNFLKKGRKNPQWATMLIMQYLVHHRERVQAGKISAGTLKQYWQAIRKFTDAFMELRTAIDWKRIIQSMPDAENYSNDRILTLDELRKLIEHHDRRVKPLICTMCSSGMRVGSWEFLQLKHITPITAAQHLRWKRQKEINESPDHTSNIVITPEDETRIIAARIILHGEKKKKKRRNSDYLSFITAEAWFAIQKWVEFRKRYGENITGDSWVMRRLFPISPKKIGGTDSVVVEEEEEDKKYRDITKHYGGSKVDVDAAHPNKLLRKAIFSLLSKAMYQQGLRTPLPEGKTRHPVKTDHFTRKFFKTRAQGYMNQANVMKLMDHKISIDPNFMLDPNFMSYWKPFEMELLDDYLRAIPSLTISEDIGDIASIKQQQVVLEQKQQDKDRQIEEMQQKLQTIEQKFGKMMQMAELWDQKWAEVQRESSPSASIVSLFREAVDRAVSESAKQNAKQVRELRKELHS